MSKNEKSKYFCEKKVFVTEMKNYALGPKKKFSKCEHIFLIDFWTFLKMATFGNFWQPKTSKNKQIFGFRYIATSYII